MIYRSINQSPGMNTRTLSLVTHHQETNSLSHGARPPSRPALRSLFQEHQRAALKIR